MYLMRRAWQPTSVFLPRETHGQRKLAAAVHGVTELDTTEVAVHEVTVHDLIWTIHLEYIVHFIYFVN